MYESKTPAQIYTLTVALVLASIGIAGLIVEAAANVPDCADLNASLLDPWHSSLYLLTALLGLATWRRAGSARIYAIAIGLFYALFALWNLLAWVQALEPGFMLLHTQLAGGVLHAVIGLAGITIGVLSPRHGRCPIPEIGSTV